MANALYNKGKESLLSCDFGWVTATNIKVVAVDSGYTVNLATHQFLSDIPAGNRVAVSGNIPGRTATDGVANGGAIDFGAVAAGADVITALVLFVDTGVEGTSRLIAYYDDVTGLPCTPNGGVITLTWDAGLNKIFRL